MGFYLDHSGLGGGTPPIDHSNIARHPRGGSEYPKTAPRRHSGLDLIEIIEGEIIPRLFLAHRDRPAHPLAGAGNAAGELGDSEFLARLFLGGDAANIVNRLQELLGGGMRRDRLYLDVLAPVPQTLSKFWADGLCSFDEIAVGLCCFDEVLRQLHAREHAAP